MNAGGEEEEVKKGFKKLRKENQNKDGMLGGNVFVNKSIG